MYYVYSTATCGAFYTLYDDSSKDIAVAKKKVHINGGHGVATKHLFTPKGVVTIVSDEDMELLEKNDSFLKHVKDGFLCVEKKEIAPEKVAVNMADKDGSAPLTPADFEDGKHSDEENKTYKKKGVPKL